MSGMNRMQLMMKLEGLVGATLETLDVPFTKQRQYSSAVDAMMFKRSANRVYCYVLHKDKTKQRTRANLVFRFRAGDDPKKWFRAEDASSLAANWRDRLTRIWSEESGTSPMFREPASATDQFGLRLTEIDLEHPSLHNTLGRFVKLAVVAAVVAEKRRDRDWSFYEELVA